MKLAAVRGFSYRWEYEECVLSIYMTLDVGRDEYCEQLSLDPVALSERMAAVSD